MVGEKPLRFGMMEYALVTGLECGEVPDKKAKAVRNSRGAKQFYNKVLQGDKSITAQVLENRLETVEFTDTEKIKVCLVLFLHSILLAGDSTKAIEKD